MCSSEVAGYLSAETTKQRLDTGILGGRLIAKKEAKGRLAKWLRKNGLALESRYGRENKIWP